MAYLQIRNLGGGVEDISYEKFITRGNLLHAWQQFSRGKWRQRAIHRFWFNLEEQLQSLYHDLTDGTYTHGSYFHFVLHDTKRRDIYVAQARDRVVHQLLSYYLEARFQPHFIAQSYAAQKGKGVHAARVYVLNVMRQLQVHGAVWVGKLDVEKYFANVDHKILIDMLGRRIRDEKIFALCKKVIESFGDDGLGLPLGNLTSQWFANIYLHELDWYAKHALHIRYYMRYNDDVIVVSEHEEMVHAWVEEIVVWVKEGLHLTIPPRKIIVAQLPQPIDVLGWRTDGRRVWIRPATMRKVTARLAEHMSNLHPVLLESMCSYAGGGIASECVNCDM